MEKVYGPVTKIRYYNDTNGFGIIFIKLDYRDNDLRKFQEKLFTNSLVVTCTFDVKPLIDEELTFDGDFVNTQYGIQFKANNFKRRNQRTRDAIITYLASEDFVGIGKTTASKIFDTLGNDCINEIIKNREILNTVDGLTDIQKNSLYDTLVLSEGNRRAIVELMNFGLTVRLSKKIINALGVNCMENIMENPYQLIDLVDGIGFFKADEIALKVGISKSSPIRIESLLMYNITREAYTKGDTYITKNKLFEESLPMINRDEDIMSKESFEKALTTLALENKIVIDNAGNISDAAIYRAELRFVQKMYEIASYTMHKKYEYSQIIKVLSDVEKANNITYSKLQKEAIIKALEEPLMIITGGPGTGKSTIIKAIIHTYMELERNDFEEETIALLAPTGRAAKRLKEVTLHPHTMTIHKFLGYEGHGKFKYGNDLKVESKFIIIDEFSMVDILLAARLFSAMENGVKVIIVGDSDQLPSVGPGDILNNLIISKEITMCKLKEIHRQASNSTIIDLAYSLNDGFLPEDILEKKKDRNFIHLAEEAVIPSIIKTIEQAIHGGMDLIKDIQVLIPMYRGEIGIDNINNRLQERFNLKDEEIKIFSKSYRVDDKVIQLVNRSEKNIMNGDIGQIISLEKENNEYIGLTVMYDHGPVTYKKEELEDITHAYAISIHKSQGSEFDLVVIPFSFKYTIMLKRKLIYTAVTRAKKYLIMLGNVRALERGISGIEESRKTKLVEMIQRTFSGEKHIIDDALSAFDNIDETEDMEKLSPYDFLD